MEESIMKFCWVTIKVRNMEESLKFYEEIVGLKIDNRYNSVPGKEIAFLGEGETKIELICDESLDEISHGEHISLGFEVNSADEMMNLLKDKGIEIHSGPFQPSPHVKFFYVLDPNGVKIQFVENI
jgi:lactoylglutathione lyase